MRCPAQPFREAFGLADEGRRACDAEAAALGLEVVARVLGAVIVAKGKAGGDVFADGAEALAHALPDRLERLEAIGAAAGLEADAFGRALVGCDDTDRLALAGHDGVSRLPPHEIDPLVMTAASWARATRRAAR